MISIVEMVNGISTNACLCGMHQEARRAAGWTVKTIGKAGGFCDDCERSRQLAPGYETPTVAFVQTGADARRPTAKECPPPKMPEQWADRLARLRAESAA